jgi:O-antigen/teichoic acid export membrane protein
LVAAAFNSAWVPFIYRIESTKLENNQPVNSRLVTYYFAIISIILLSVILFTRDISFLVLPEQYRRIDSLATLIAIGQLFQAIYFIPVNFLFLRAKTKYIPIITLLSGGIDISLNLLFVPRYGVAAAAWAGIISKVVMALTAYLISMKYYPFKYEYIRISKLAVMVLFFILVHQLIGQPSVSKSLAIHSIMLFSIPFFLLVIGFFYKDETMHIKTLIGRVTDG